MGHMKRLISGRVPYPTFHRRKISTSCYLRQLTEENCERFTTPFVVYDTAKRTKCQLTTQRPNILKWYSCGPTVYDSCHVGHATTFVRSDIIRRLLEAEGITVIQVMGITDIDDKIIRKANQQGSDWRAIGKKYENEFVGDLQTLNCLRPHIFTRVSDYLPEIVSFVGKLLDNETAYRVATGSIYFDTDKYGERYGLFRRLPEGDGEPGEGKRSTKDFALWKASKEGEPFWEAPWGKGRPGWHIECSVMATRIFGSKLDLHTGGRDLIFPHHENEEAQCCAYFGNSHWTSHWLHTGHLHFKGESEKMSKSLGNTVSIPDFLSNSTQDVLRTMCLSAKYRSNLEYSQDSIELATKILRKLNNFISETSAILSGVKQVSSQVPPSDSWKFLESAKLKLTSAFHDDFDTPEALKIVMDAMLQFRHTFPDDYTSSRKCSVDFQLVLAYQIFVQNFLKLTGISLETGQVSFQEDVILDTVISQLIQFRSQVRDFSLAKAEPDKALRKTLAQERRSLLEACDLVRDNILAEAQIEIKDHNNSASWTKVAKKY